MAARLRRVDLAGLLDAGLTFVAAFTIGLYAVRSLCGPELVPMRCSLPPTCSSALLNARTRHAVAGQLNSPRALDVATVEAYRYREKPRWPEARSKRPDSGRWRVGCATSTASHCPSRKIDCSLTLLHRPASTTVISRRRRSARSAACHRQDHRRTGPEPLLDQEPDTTALPHFLTRHRYSTRIQGPPSVIAAHPLPALAGTLQDVLEYSFDVVGRGPVREMLLEAPRVADPPLVVTGPVGLFVAPL
jgi:hypothetical protein